MIENESISFCCSGCEGVYRFLRSNRLDRYYEILSGLNHQAPSQSSHVTADIPRMLECNPLAFKYGSDPSTYAIYVPAFNCAACLWLVERQIADTDNLSQFRINLEEHLLILTIDEAPEVALPIVLQKLATIGYKGTAPHSESSQGLASVKMSEDLIQLGIAGAVFANVMLFSSSVYFIDLFGKDQNFSRYFNIMSLTLTMISLVTVGKIFYQNALRGLKTRLLHIDLPIAVALSAALGTSIYHMMMGTNEVYFDSITGLIFFLRLGRYLSDSLIARARRLLGVSTDLFGQRRTDLQVGSEILVDHGAVIPADGTITSERAEISEAFLTGESTPTLKVLGDAVYGGTINSGSPIKLVISASGEETRIARLSRLISHVSLQSARSETRTKWIAKWFIVLTIVLSSAAIVFWHSAGFSTTLEIVCSILIVSCPCALAMAIPLSNALAIKRSWASGVVIRNINAFEQARSVDTIIFDKTGTLTTGQLEVVEILRPDTDEEFPFGSLQKITQDCIHPVAKAIHQWSEQFAPTEIDIQSMRIHSGLGMTTDGTIVHINKRKAIRVHIGSLRWLGELSRSDHMRRFFIDAAATAGENHLSGVLVQNFDDQDINENAVILIMKDQIRTDAKEVVSAARESGFRLRMLSGDREITAQDIGKKLGFKADEILSETLPEEKLRYVESLKTRNHRVMMVGDGINDAAVLKVSDLGVAVAGGTDLTRETSDVVLTTRSLRAVLDIALYSRYHFRTQNLILTTSFCYNLTAVSLALTNHIHPLTAALIMPMSSLTVLALAWIRKGNSIWKSSTL